MTIYDHIENIKLQCEFMLKELEKEKSIYDYWITENKATDNKFLEDLYTKIDSEKLYNKIKNKKDDTI